MANTFKNLSQEDISNSRTYLYEQIPITGSIVSGTYSSSAGEGNILNYSHGMFQTVYDYPYLSSSANNLMDITVGFGSGSLLASQVNVANYGKKKKNIYNQLAKVLYGTDVTGAINLLDRDGVTDSSADKMPNGFFLTFSRLLVKDEIKKGTFKLKLALSGGTSASPVGTQNDSNRFVLTGTLSDLSGAFATPGYLTNSPVGDYGILYLSESAAGSKANYGSNPDPRVGLIFYQAGVVFINSDIFAAYSASTDSSVSLVTSSRGQLAAPALMTGSTANYLHVQDLFLSGTVSDACDSFRRRLYNVEFQNTTQLNSTIYFLRANNNEFNYSSNPTYLSGSQIVVKGGLRQNAPVSYITTAGLYSSDGDLMAVAKLSQPLKKTEEQSLILRVRLDY
jgi:hypothetical protein